MPRLTNEQVYVDTGVAKQRQPLYVPDIAAPILGRPKESEITVPPHPSVSIPTGIRVGDFVIVSPRAIKEKLLGEQHWLYSHKSTDFRFQVTKAPTQYSGGEFYGCEYGALPPTYYMSVVYSDYNEPSDDNWKYVLATLVERGRGIPYEDVRAYMDECSDNEMLNCRDIIGDVLYLQPVRNLRSDLIRYFIDSDDDAMGYWAKDVIEVVIKSADLLSVYETLKSKGDHHLAGALLRGKEPELVEELMKTNDHAQLAGDFFNHYDGTAKKFYAGREEYYIIYV